MKMLLKKMMSFLLAAVLTIGMGNLAPDMKAPVRAEEPAMGALFAMEFHGQGWGQWSPDNRRVYRSAAYPTAFRATLEHQPAGMTGTIQYQVSMTGSGWTAVGEAGSIVGSEGGSNAIESIKVWLNGDLANSYDVYTMVMTGGKWTDWKVNGAEAGQAGSGTHINGIRIAVVSKGKTPAEVPEEHPAAAAGSGTAFVSCANIDPSRPMVALTFDDGPGQYEGRILSALEAVGGRATFFMVGNLVGSHAADVQRMVADGCEIGNHSYKHENLSKLSSSAVVSTIQKTNDALKAACGQPATVVRPPYGATGGNCKSALASMGYASILWSIDTLDWKTRNADSTVNSVLNNVKDGDIVLMHSIYSQTAAAVERIVPALVQRGFQLVTVSELAAARGGMTPGKNYGSFRR